MKRLLPVLLILLGVYTANAQVGIGTTTPNPSAQLQIVSGDKGVLIPQVQLTSTTDTTTITNGNVQSLLVYNITSNSQIKPGYYYWYVNKWYRLLSDGDAGQGDSAQPIIDNGNGTYTYTNPDGSVTTIDVPGNQTLTFLVYNPTAKTLTYTAENGFNTVIDLDAVVKASETVTTLVDNGNGTVTFTNEAGVATTINLAGGTQGVGIASTVDNGNGTFTLHYTDGTSFTTANLTGPQGAVGAIGQSAYQTWLNAGNTGTEADFLAALQGAAGAVGASGVGIQNVVNNGDGTFTINFTDGTSFTTSSFLGPQGPVGATGAQGQAGAIGATGADGKGIASTTDNGNGTFTINYTDGTSFTTSNLTGPQGATGMQGVAGATGADGKGIVSTTDNGNGTFTINFTDGTSFTTSNLTGPQGATGTQGIQGPQGATGNDGVAGPQGATGADGKGIATTVDNGNGTFTINYTDGTSFTTSNLTGPQGATGTQGVAGATGADGKGIASTTDNGNGTFTINYTDGTSFTTSNLTGPHGATGNDGVAGPQGATGADGKGIASTIDNNNGTFTINYTDGTSFTTSNLTGPQGATGTQGVAGAT
ncbi:beta strand repeat-containing protein, partial [Flavobacterium suzhouense]